ncbi:MAG: hypothetical protein ACOH5I_10645 [Oligoflexus sp.]
MNRSFVHTIGVVVSCLLLLACKPTSKSETPIAESDEAEAIPAQWYDCSKPTIQPHYIVTMTEPYLVDRPFRIEIPASNEKAYQEIEKRLRQGFQPDTFGNIMGRIVEVKASPNHAWKFRLQPTSIVVGDYNMDSCDGSLEFTEENLVIFQGKKFCAFQAANLITKIEKVWQIPSCE